MVPPREEKEARWGGVQGWEGEPSPSPHMLSHPPLLSWEEPDLQMGTGTFSRNGLSRILNLENDSSQQLRQRREVFKVRRPTGRSARVQHVHMPLIPRDGGGLGKVGWSEGKLGLLRKAFLRQDWSRPLSQPTVPAMAKDNSRSKKQDQGALEKLHSRRGPPPRPQQEG